MPRWKKIKDFPLYEVSDAGFVRRAVTSSGARAGRVLKPSVDKYGHQQVFLSKGGGDFRHCIVHRLVAFEFVGPPPSVKHEVAHNDGDPSNNHYSNLRWATRRENARDAIEHGTIARGERHGCAKLTEAKVRDILAADGMLKEISVLFGVPISTVHAIRCGRLWSHLTT